MIATRGVILELCSGPMPEHDSSILGSVVFGADRCAVCATTTGIALPMKPLGDGPSAELWRTGGPVERLTRGEFVFARNGDVLFGATAACESIGLRRRAAAIYQAAIAVAREEGYPHIVRMWNHFPEIHGAEEGLERYKVFCAGRAEGFEHSGFALDGDLPSASGVGTDGDGLLVMFIASKRPVVHVENPRQVSAFRYPTKYGPRPPSFARASIADFGGEKQLFVSGTASIVGSESVHAGNLELQLRETLENLRAVCEKASDGKYRELSSLPHPVFRIYVRHMGDFATLREMFHEAVGSATEAIWVRGDICREELLLEIELWTRL